MNASGACLYEVRLWHSITAHQLGKIIYALVFHSLRAKLSISLSIFDPLLRCSATSLVIRVILFLAALYFFLNLFLHGFDGVQIRLLDPA